VLPAQPAPPLQTQQAASAPAFSTPAHAWRPPAPLAGAQAPLATAHVPRSHAAPAPAPAPAPARPLQPLSAFALSARGYAYDPFSPAVGAPRSPPAGWGGEEAPPAAAPPRQAQPALLPPLPLHSVTDSLEQERSSRRAMEAECEELERQLEQMRRQRGL
jgi:hypothetical protein